MLENAVARRYAQAFFAIAKEKNIVEQLENELKLVVTAIAENAELKKVLNHQLVSPEAKKDVLTNVFSGEVSEITMDFINVVTDKYRASYIPEIYEEFVNSANRLRNMADAYVKSATQLTDEDTKAINAKLNEITGKTIRLSTEVDPSLIGGVVVRIGDKVIDGSVAGRLAKLKQNLLHTEVKEIGVRN